MTTINIDVLNKATKQHQTVARYKAQYRRSHGRPRNIGKYWKVKPLPLKKVGSGEEN